MVNLMLISRILRFIAIIIYFLIFNTKVTMILLMGLFRSLKIDGKFRSKINFTYLIMSGCYVMSSIKTLQIKVKY